MKMYSFIFAVTCLLTGLVTAGTIHVPADQPTIQTGIDSASTRDTVLVADGTYFENIDFKGKAITVASHYAVDQDTMHIKNTVIDGSKASNSDNASVVYFKSGEDTTSLLTGFTITGGKGSKTGGTVFGKKINGGGIFCQKSAARIVHNIIRDNSAIGKQESGGGGIYATPDNNLDKLLIIEDNLFLRNHAESSVDEAAGGAVWTDMNTRAHYNIFLDNTCNGQKVCSGAALAGGGYAPGRYEMSFCHNIVKNNVCTTNLKGGWSHGAVITVYNKNTIKNNHFVGNKNEGASSRARSSALMVYESNTNTLIAKNRFVQNRHHSLVDSYWGAALFVQNSTQVLVDDNLFEENSCKAGPGVYFFRSEGTIRNNTITKNPAIEFAAGLESYQSKLLVENNTISKNECTKDGGSGSVWLIESTGVLQNNLIIRNKASRGAGIGVWVILNNSIKQNFFPENNSSWLRDNCLYRAARDSSLDVDGLVLINKTICHNTGWQGGGLYMNGWNVYAFNNIFWGNNSSFNSQQIFRDRGSGKLTIQNCVVENGWASGDNILDTDPLLDESTWELTEDSPCIGSGILEMDIDGQLFVCPCYDLYGNERPMSSLSNPDIGSVENALDFPSGVSKAQSTLPNEFRLLQNYPNPFNPSTTIEYDVPSNQLVKLRIYDLLGRHIRTLTETHHNAGRYSITWDAVDERGKGVPAGVYLCRLQSGDVSRTIKMVLVR